MNMVRFAVAQFLASIGTYLWPDVAPFFGRHRRLAACLFFLIMAAVVAVAFLGCATGPMTIPNSQTFYRRDMLITVDGVQFPGYGVLPIKDKYQITVETKHDMDRFTATSCHRQIVQEKVGNSGWFSKSTKYSFQFQRSNGVEQSDPCPLQLTGSAETNEHSWGFLDFQTKSETLPAVLECDGWQQTYNGVSVCQAMKALTQKITFAKPVRTAFQSPCVMPIPKDGKTFEYDMPPGRCVFVFCTDDKQCHRMTTIGYDEAWVRGK